MTQKLIPALTALLGDLQDYLQYLEAQQQRERELLTWENQLQAQEKTLSIERESVENKAREVMERESKLDTEEEQHKFWEKQVERHEVKAKELLEKEKQLVEERQQLEIEKKEIKFQLEQARKLSEKEKLITAEIEADRKRKAIMELKERKIQERLAQLKIEEAT